MLSQFVLILPEIALTIIAMCMQLLAVFFKNHLRPIVFLTIVSLIALAISIIYFAPAEATTVFSNSFELSYYICLYKYGPIVQGIE